MFTYRPHFIPANVVLIGAGGTGSRLMPMLCQLIRSSIRRHNPLSWIENINLWVVDGDTVEHKNLVRQNFIERDVGKNKAQVVADRYSAAFDIPIKAITRYITPNDSLVYETPLGAESFASALRNAVIIVAVDSAEARRILLSNFLGHSLNQFWVDAGNEDDFGQVRIFTPHVWVYNPSSSQTLEKTKEYLLQGLPEMIPSRLMIDYLPMPIRHYFELGQSAQEQSCAELPQTLAINSIMANLILANVQNFIQLRNFNYDCQYYSLQGNMTTTQLSAPLLAQRYIDSAWANNNHSAGKEADKTLEQLRIGLSKLRQVGFGVRGGYSFTEGLSSTLTSGESYERTKAVFLEQYGPLLALAWHLRGEFRNMGMILKLDGTLSPIEVTESVTKKPAKKKAKVQPEVVTDQGTPLTA